MTGVQTCALPICHEAPGAGRDREATDAAAPAFGTVIDFELTDASGDRVRAVDLRGRWLLIFFGYSVLQAHAERSSSWTDQSCGQAA